MIKWSWSMNCGDCVVCGDRMMLSTDFSYWCTGCDYSCVIYDEDYCKWGGVLESGFP